MSEQTLYIHRKRNEVLFTPVSALLGQNRLFCSDQLTVFPEQESLIDIRSTLEQYHFSALLWQYE